MGQVSGVIDLLVVGGGINGCGIARDAAGRGLTVMLVERDDLASATSSWSSKLIHGGLRYLEQYEFRLVREALREREVLLRLAPHIIRPIIFVLPHVASMRPAWMIRIGLWLYDHLGGPISLPPQLRRGQKTELEEDMVAKILEWAEMAPSPRRKPRQPAASTSAHALCPSGFLKVDPPVRERSGCDASRSAAIRSISAPIIVGAPGTPANVAATTIAPSGKAEWR